MGKKLSVYENNVDKAWYDSSTVFYSECDDKDDALKDVIVVFKNGAAYCYKDVNVNDYLMFRESSSQGKALNKFLKKYEFDRLLKHDIDLLTEEYNSLLNKALNENDKKTYIISVFPGCGKTYTYNKLKQKYNILDLDSSLFPKNDFPSGYVKYINEKIGQYDIIFISSHENVRQMLCDNGIEYYLFYPNVNRKNEFINLYLERGNDGSFVDLMNNHFENFVKSVEDDKTQNKFCLNNESEFLLTNQKFIEILNNINKNTNE